MNRHTIRKIADLAIFYLGFREMMAALIDIGRVLEQEDRELEALKALEERAERWRALSKQHDEGPWGGTDEECAAGKHCPCFDECGSCCNGCMTDEARADLDR